MCFTGAYFTYDVHAICAFVAIFIAVGLAELRTGIKDVFITLQAIFQIIV